MTSKSVLKITSGPHEIIMRQGGTFHFTDVVGASENAVELSETRSFGQVGSTVSGMTVKPRDITIIGIITSDVEVNRRWLLSCVVPGRMIRIVVEQNGESFYIEGWPVQTPQIGHGDRIQDFNFKVRCPYPYWYAEETTYTFSNTTGLWMYPRTLDSTYRLGELPVVNDIIFRNIGDVNVPLKIYVKPTGIAQECAIYNNTTGQYILVSKELLAGELLYICTAPSQKEVTHIAANGTRTNCFSLLLYGSDTSMYLAPGDNLMTTDNGMNQNWNYDITVVAPKGVLAGV